MTLIVLIAYNTKKASVQAQAQAKIIENQRKSLGKILREDLKTGQSEVKKNEDNDRN